MSSSDVSACEPGSPEDLALIEAAFVQLDAMYTRVVLAVGRLSGSGVCESVEGLELAHWLTLAGRLPEAEARRVVATGELLADLPGLRGLLEAGVLSYGCVQAVCARLRGLSRAQRAVVDARLVATVAQRGDLEAFGADGLVEAAAAAADELRSPGQAAERDRRRERSSRVIVQGRLDGSGGVAICDLGPQSFSACLAATAQAGADALAAGDSPERIPAGVLAEDPDPLHPDARQGDPADQPEFSRSDGFGRSDAGGSGAGGSGGSAGRRRFSRAQLLAMGLRRMAACYLGDPHRDGDPKAATDLHADADVDAADAPAEAPRGEPHAPDAGDQSHGGCEAGCGGARRWWRPARPLIEVLVDLRDPTMTATGLVLSRARGDLPRLSARTVEAIAADADVRASIFDGARPLAVSARRRAPAAAPPAKVKVAVRLRDRGDRFPGSRLPLADCDLDHLTPRCDGGGHDPTNLAAINIHSNRRRPITGWQLQLLDDGELIATRRHRRWRSLPRGTPLAPALPVHDSPHEGPPRDGLRDDRPPDDRRSPDLPF